MAHEESAELSEPCVGAFDDPAALVSPKFSAVFIAPVPAAFAVPHDEVGPRSRALACCAAGPWDGDLDLGERGFRKRNFCRRGTFEPNSQPKTPTVDQYHPLCALAALGFTNRGAPFLAGAKLPSRNVSSHFSSPLPSSAPSSVARRPATHSVLPTASTAASRSPARDTGRARTSKPRLSAIPTECLLGKPGRVPTDGPAYPCAASVQAAKDQSTPTVPLSTTQIASCSCKKFNRLKQKNQA